MKNASTQFSPYFYFGIDNKQRGQIHCLKCFHAIFAFPTRIRAGNLWCLDLAPAPGGKIGQIIDFDHEVGPTKVIATSFQELLSTFAAQLEAGHYVVAGLNLCDPENVLDDLDNEEEIEDDDE